MRRVAWLVAMAWGISFGAGCGWFGGSSNNVMPACAPGVVDGGGACFTPPTWEDTHPGQDGGPATVTVSLEEGQGWCVEYPVGLGRWINECLVDDRMMSQDGTEACCLKRDGLSE